MDRYQNDRMNRRSNYRDSYRDEYRDEDTFGRGEFENFDRDDRRRDFGSRDESIGEKFQRGMRNIKRSFDPDSDNGYDRFDREPRYSRDMSRDSRGRFNINGNQNRDNWDTERTAREEYGLGGFNQGSRQNDRDYESYDRRPHSRFMNTLMSLGSEGMNRMDRMDEGRGRHEDRGFYGKGPKGWKRSDERIKDDVCEALNDDWRVDASDIEVSVKDGRVHLRGMVDGRSTKCAAERCVENIRGVIDVQNDLTFKHSENVTDLRKTSGLS